MIAFWDDVKDPTTPNAHGCDILRESIAIVDEITGLLRNREHLLDWSILTSGGLFLLLQMVLPTLNR